LFEKDAEDKSRDKNLSAVSPFIGTKLLFTDTLQISINLLPIQKLIRLCEAFVNNRQKSLERRGIEVQKIS